VNSVRTIAFAGLGQMGRRMVPHLERAGYTLRTFDLNGSGNCASAREAASGADVMITMLPDGKAVTQAVLAALPSLARGAIVVDMSSSDPVGTRALGARLAGHGVALVDAPVSGAKAGAEQATLAIMAGGEPASVERVRPVLEKMGSKVFHTGPLGSGHAMKALNNYIGASGTIAAFEALLIGQAFGLDPKLMTEVFNASTGYNSTTQRKIPQQVLTGAFASGFSMALMTKDVGIAASLARATGTRARYLRDTLRIWREALERMPGADHSEMYRYLEKLRPPGAAARRKSAPSRGAASPRAKRRRTPRRSTSAAGRRRSA
jgi:3-hydroxyisobutyrate dehydrogenase